MTPTTNEIQNAVTQARMKLNRIKVKMSKTRDEEVWLELAKAHAEMTMLRSNLQAQLRGEK